MRTQLNRNSAHVAGADGGRSRSPALARVRFLAFLVIVLGLPALLMSRGGQQMIDLGKLSLVLLPGVAGLILNGGLGKETIARSWRRVGLAAGVTISVSVGTLAVSLAAGAAAFGGPNSDATGAVLAMGATGLTSVLEELGWAGGGLALAQKACGRRLGVLILGLAWASWHLIPTFLRVGLFPELEAAPPAMLAAFVAGCLVYRDLLTRLRLRAGTWLAAAAAHAAPNVLLTGLVGAGLMIQTPGADWRLFPAPGGLGFLGLAVAALVWLSLSRAGRSMMGATHER